MTSLQYATWKTISCFILIVLTPIRHSGAQAFDLASTDSSYSNAIDKTSASDSTVNHYGEKPKKPASFKMNGNLRTRGYIDTVHDDLEDHYASDSCLTIENKIKLPEYNVSGFVSFDARYDFNASDERTRWAFDVLLQEVYVQVKKNRWKSSFICCN